MKKRKANPDQDQTAFYTYKDLECSYKKSRVTIWKWQRLGLFPRAYRLGPNSVGFKASEIHSFEEDPEGWPGQA